MSIDSYIYRPARVGGRDIVSVIQKKKNAQKKKKNDRCYATNSCDCSRCR